MSETQAATVDLSGQGGARVPETILGYNLEATEKTVRGMLSNRLANPKLIGPADANGFAPPWRSSIDFFHATMAASDPGVSLSGTGSSQMLHSYSANNQVAPQMMVQTEREVRAGERLEVVIWAKTRHQPTRLKIEIRPTAMGGETYASAELVVETPYWSRHTVALEAPVDDLHAVFGCGIVGCGLVWIDQISVRAEGEGNVAPAVAERLERLRVPVLRFPGGCLTTNYRWRHGTGPVELRPATLDTANHRNLLYDFGTDEYLELCMAQGITPHITVNLGTGTPAEAGEWAAYVADWYRDRGAEPATAYFQVGNEEYGSHEHSHMTGEMYADCLRAFVPAIREGHPATRIVAVAERHGQTLSEEDASWRQAMLPAAKELGIEVLVVHIYRFGSPTDAKAQLASAVSSVASADEVLRQLIADCREAGVESRFGVTEWNFWTDASHWDGPMAFERSGATMAEPYGGSHAVFAAGMIHNFARLAPDFELGNFYHLMNGMGVITRRGLDVIDGPLAALFELYRPALPGARIDVGAGPGTEDPLDAVALQNDDGTWLFLVNRSAHSGLAARVDGRDREPAEITALAAPSPREPLAAASAPAWSAGGIEVPPLGIVRLRWAA